MEDKKIRPLTLMREGDTERASLRGTSFTNPVSKDSNNGFITQARDGQLRKIIDYLGDTSTDGHTRMQVSRATGIERASVCRRVAILRKVGKIWSCGKRLDPLTGCRAEYLTTNPNVAIRHFAKSCWSLLEGQDQDTQLHILEALKAYVLEQRGVFNLFNLPSLDEVRTIWETRVKPMIDKELT